MKFTTIKSNNPISKKFSLEDGKLVKTDGGSLKVGKFDSQENIGISDLKKYMESDACDSRVIIVPGTPRYKDGFVVTKAELKRREKEDEAQPDAKLISRSRDCFSYSGEGFLLIDYDPNPDEEFPLSKNGLIETLIEVMPELKNAPMLWKTSSSSNIFSDDEKGNKIEYKGISGQHIFVAVKDTSDIERVIEILYEKLWNAGNGYIFIDKAGGMHKRTIIDRVVNSPEREIFIKSDCIPPLYQEIEYDLINEKAEPLDTRVIKNNSREEKQKFKDISNNKLEENKKESEKRIAIYTEKMAASIGMTKTMLAECIRYRVLYGDSHVKISNGTEVTVRQLFEDSDKYDGMYCHDPLEPDYGGGSGSSYKAWIDLSNRRIHSHAHGGIHYDLEVSDRTTPYELALSICDTEDHSILFKKAASKALEYGYGPTEVDQLLVHIAKLGKLKAGSVKKAYDEKASSLGSFDVESGGVIEFFNHETLDEDGNFFEELITKNLGDSLTSRFPHTRLVNGKPKNINTSANFEYACKGYGIQIAYDLIKKDIEVTFPGDELVSDYDKENSDNREDVILTVFEDMSELNGLNPLKKTYIANYADKNKINPVLSWVTSKKWDGRKRIELVQENITVNDYEIELDNYEKNAKFSKDYKNKLTFTWFIQCVAALDDKRNSPLYHKTGGEGHEKAISKFEYILVFIGDQGIQKTKFLQSLLPEKMAYKYIKTGHELDTKLPDSKKVALSYWITELGELDSTFRKSDISALKAFMSDEKDSLRTLYKAKHSDQKRRTSFCGTVNDQKFLVDDTGNRRYLPLNVQALSPLYSIYCPWVDTKGRNIEVIVGIGEGAYKDSYYEKIDGIVYEKDAGFGSEFFEESSVYGIIEGTNTAKRIICGLMSGDHECQQFWAEAYHHYLQGAQWWPNKSLENDLRHAYGEHEQISPVKEMIEEEFEMSLNGEWRKKRRIKCSAKSLDIEVEFEMLTVTDICKQLEIGDPKPTNEIKTYIEKKGFKYGRGTKEFYGKSGYWLALKQGKKLKRNLEFVGKPKPKTKNN